MAPESRTGGIVWHWTEDTWSWNPSSGRWSSEHGVPKSVASLEISTEEIPAKERYDFGREMVFYDFEADQASYDEKEGFRARGAAVMAPRGGFVVYRSDGISGHRTPAQARREEGGDIDIGVVFSGVRHHELECGTTLSANPGEPFVYDPDHPCRVHWSAHLGAHLKLRRKAVENVIGGKVPPEPTLVKAIANSHLWPYLRSHMRLFGERLAQMPASAQAVVLETMIV